MGDKTVPDKVEVPKDQSKTAQAAAPIASLSSHADPYPQYIASLLCGGTALYAYNGGWQPKAVAAAAGFALSYFSAGRMVATGYEKLGYDLGTFTSLGLMSWMVPAAGKNTASTALSVVGSMSAVANGIKSYEIRTGKPKEVIEK